MLLLLSDSILFIKVLLIYNFHDILSNLFWALLLKGGGAQVATLPLWPCLLPSECDGPGPPEVLGRDFDQCGMYFRKAYLILTSLNFPTTISTDMPRAISGAYNKEKEKSFLLHVCQVQSQMPMAVAVCLVARGSGAAQWSLQETVPAWYACITAIVCKEPLA